MSNLELKYRVLKLLECQPNLTQRQAAKELGISLGKTHYLIKSLVDIGCIKFENFKRSDNKLGYSYVLTPSGIAEKAAITSEFLIRKTQEYNELSKEIKFLQEEVKNHKDKIN
tara:strand:- start:276 stop:614 length:339 start_codon:yes stop_codon:yes gene_type:complete